MEKMVVCLCLGGVFWKRGIKYRLKKVSGGMKIEFRNNEKV